MVENIVTREINVGRITGLSAYELAVAAGTFEGTEQEYNEKEKEVFEVVSQFNRDKETILNTLSNMGVITAGSWFVLNDITDLDQVLEPVVTFMNPNYVMKGLPSTIVNDNTSNSTCHFESRVTLLDNGTPSTIVQTITQMNTVSREITIFKRMQLALGEPSSTKWSKWKTI